MFKALPRVQRECDDELVQVVVAQAKLPWPRSKVRSVSFPRAVLLERDDDDDDTLDSIQYRYRISSSYGTYALVFFVILSLPLHF